MPGLADRAPSAEGRPFGLLLQPSSQDEVKWLVFI